MAEWADGPRLFEHLWDHPGALRLSDLPACVRSLGFSSDLMPSKTLQGPLIGHRGVHVGNFFLAAKEGGREFTSENDETLMLFAAQAAVAAENRNQRSAIGYNHGGYGECIYGYLSLFLKSVSLSIQQLPAGHLQHFLH